MQKRRTGQLGMDMFAPWRIYLDGEVVKESHSSEAAAERRYRRLLKVMKASAERSRSSGRENLSLKP